MNSIVKIARERGRGMKVEQESARPAVIAVRIRHDMCPICKVVESQFDPILELANENGVLLVTIDLSTEETQRQSGLLIASLGLEQLWPSDFTGLGSVTLLDGMSHEVLASVQTDDVAVIEDAVLTGIDASTAASRVDGGMLNLVRGATEQMKELAWMVGEWDVEFHKVAPDGSMTLAEETQSHITSELDGCILRESMQLNMGASGSQIKMLSLRSFDQFRGVYRFVWLENMMGLSDVLEGRKDDSGAITTTNLRSGTGLPNMPGGQMLHARVSLAKTDDDEFTVSYESSDDGGLSWEPSGRIDYKRQTK